MTWRTRKRPIRRRVRPRGKLPIRLGSHRERVKYADDLWKKLIRAKEPSGVCPRCFKRKWSDAAHCWAKGPYPALRHDPSNGAPLCRPCHGRIDSDHQAKTDFFVAYMGPVEYERLRLRAQTRAKSDLALTILELERPGRVSRNGDTR